MKYRLAKTVDYRSIAELHYNIRETYSVGIFAQLGKSFLNQYYRILLNDPNSVVVCAEDDYGIIQGFCSATLNIEEQMNNIRLHKLKLGLAAITSIIRTPSLLKHLIHRYKAINNDPKTKIISTKGARMEYWVWKTYNKNSLSSVEMFFKLLNIVKALGVNEIFGEVDIVNKKILLFHKANGCKVIDQISLPDGRERVLIKLDLINWTKAV